MLCWWKVSWPVYCIFVFFKGWFNSCLFS
jgi:hypothetical protein